MRYKRGKEGDGRKALVERERRCSEPLECTSTRKAGWDNLKFFGAVSPALFLPASSFTSRSLTSFPLSLSLSLSAMGSEVPLQPPGSCGSYNKQVRRLLGPLWSRTRR